MDGVRRPVFHHATGVTEEWTPEQIEAFQSHRHRRTERSLKGDLEQAKRDTRWPNEWGLTQAQVIENIEFLLQYCWRPRGKDSVPSEQLALF